MDDSPAVADRTEEFNARYRLVGEAAVRRAERRVIGSNYGATSYTTKAQADELARRLGLRPGKLLLDIGTGAGWPGVYVGASTGCRVVLIDKPLEGLRVASGRMRAEAVAGGAINGVGETLPLADETFDAVTSSDVLC